MKAFRFFRYAVPVSILLIRVLAFYMCQLLAVAGLALDVLVLFVLRYIMDAERAKMAGFPGIPT